MGNRNAAKHLILVASILICFFAYMGYRFLGPGSRDNVDDATVAAPSASPLPGLTPPGGGTLSDNDIDQWVPSLAGDDLPLETGNGPVVMPPPSGSGSSSGAATASSSTPHSGAITGLVPGPPTDTAAPLRPATSSSSAPTSLPIPPSGATAATGSGSIPPSLTPPGSGSGSAASGFGSTSTSGSGFSTADDDDSGDIPSAGDGWTSLPFDDNGDDDFASTNSPPGVTPADSSTSLAGAPITPPGTSRPATTLRPTSASAASGSTPATAGPSTPVPPVTRPGSATAASGTSVAMVPPAATRPGATGPAGTSVTSRPPPPVSGTMPYDPEEDEDDELNLSGSESLRIYVVLPDDTLTSIAARELGAASLADNIFLLNRDVIPDPNQLMAGSKIRLPVRNAPGRGPDGDPYPVRRPTQGLGNVHTVARGDTLSSISLQYYGTSTAWRQLHEVNRNIIPNPNQLVVGMELTIPPFDELPR
ncbi:MAG: LysM peptidoglycan-binding domain-containing protein [Planctomycetes bacterium]|nr:LysM peptidoglycan-binding domain-containing protein [Planctomycetota bacterium]